MVKISYIVDDEWITSWVAFENYFFTELESYASDTASHYQMTATESTEILQIHKKNVDFLTEKHSWWQKFMFLNHQQTIINLIKVIESFQSQSAQMRYENLFHFPYFLQKIKQKDLATMLGITPYSLSRLRGKK